MSLPSLLPKMAETRTVIRVFLALWIFASFVTSHSLSVVRQRRQIIKPRVQA